MKLVKVPFLMQRKYSYKTYFYTIQVSTLSER